MRITGTCREVIEKSEWLAIAAANLTRDPLAELLFVARDVRNSDGDGQGCTVRGVGAVETSGARAEAVRRQFPWPRGVSVVKVEGARTHLP